MKNFLFSILMMTVFFMAASVLSSCSQNLQNDDITVFLPQWPVQKEGLTFPSLAFWEITIFDGSEKMTFTLENSADSFSILATGFPLEKNRFFTVSARAVSLSPQNEETAFFKAAGSVYPHLAEDSKLNLTWQDGFTAFIADCILEPDKAGLYTKNQKQSFCEHFNWKKFSQCLTEKGRNPLYNPWLCDKARIVSSICGKRFSSIYLNVKKGTLECPSPLGGGFSSYIPAKKLSE